MTMLADHVEVVVGVDTHKHTHTAAVLSAATGGVLEEMTVGADPKGFAELVGLADQHGACRAWAIEGTGSYGVGLTRFLQERAEHVIEVDRPRRSRPLDGAKSDSIDAIRAAREVLGRQRLASPRTRGERAALAAVLAARRSAVKAATDAERQLLGIVVTALKSSPRSSAVFAPSESSPEPPGCGSIRAARTRRCGPRPFCAPSLAGSSRFRRRPKSTGV